MLNEQEANITRYRRSSAATRKLLIQNLTPAFLYLKFSSL